tara:strand:- start:4223 stop:4384 length:162 start_codon:yes stop_codon:yes gene_type:complete
MLGEGELNFVFKKAMAAFLFAIEKYLLSGLLGRNFKISCSTYSISVSRQTKLD